MEERYDIVIIGGGPAGLSAAITARARNKKVLVVSNSTKENPLAASKLVDNYPGMPGATGVHILETMHRQARDQGTRFLQARAISIVPMQLTDNDSPSSRDKENKGEGAGFSVTTSSDYIEANSVVIACGVSSGGKPFIGEAEYLGRGVSYCATCDGMLYRSSAVLIVGLSKEAAGEANFMAEIGATVHFVAREIPKELDARIYRHEGKLISIEGDVMGVTKVTLEERSKVEAEQTEGGAEHLSSSTKQDELMQGAPKSTPGKPKIVPLEVNGVFILRPGVAPTSMLSSLKIENGYIKIDASMRTNVPGVFAAGDCTGKPLQIAAAVGQGQVAVFSAVDYLAN